MRKLKNTPVFNFIVFFLVLVLSTILPLFFSGVSANALGFSSADYFSWTTTNSRVYTADDYWSLNIASSTGGIARTGTFTGAGTGTISYLHLCTNSTIPGNSLVHFNITSYLDSRYVPVSLNSRDSRMAFLNESFGEYGRGSYLFYLDSSATGCFDFGVNNQISAYWSGEVRFEVSGIDATTLSGDASYSAVLNDIKYLNQDQYNRLVDLLSQGNGAATQRTTIIDDLEDILDEIQSSSAAEVGAINNLRGDVQAQTEQQHEDYENEVQREEDKQDELEDQADDVNISANAISNPFSNLFSSANCASLPTLASWLHVSANNIQVCSPYPQQFRPIIEFVSSAIVVGLLIRVYYKQLRGGYDS